MTRGRVLRSVFFGGGTPSLMATRTVAAILEAASATWSFANDIEITLEANPTSVEAARFIGYRDAGVNRISMGIQSFNDTDLRALGRLHSAAEALSAFDVARSLFQRVSFDLIYARQDQTLTAWRTELLRALDMAVDHLSLYQLTIEPQTAFGARHAAGKLLGLPADDLSADMYDVTQEVCDQAGFPAYEVSNHARKGQESRHNLIYWQAGDYAGIGPGAHGRLTRDGVRRSTETLLAPSAWLTKVEKTGDGEIAPEVLTPDMQRTEYFLMGLRLADGIDLRRFGLAADLKLKRRIDHLVSEGVVARCDDRLIINPSARPILNTVLMRLLDD